MALIGIGTVLETTGTPSLIAAAVTFGTVACCLMLIAAEIVHQANKQQ